MGRVFVAVGALFGLTSILAAAAGAHLGYARAAGGWYAATFLLLVHGLAIVAIGLAELYRSPESACRPAQRRAFMGAAVAFIVGALLFNGVMFASAFVDWLNQSLMPVGGLMLMLGWLLLLVGAVWPGGRRAED